MDLNGKVALVTGAAAGIGAATVAALEAAGATVAAHRHRGGEFAADLARPEAAEELVARVRERWGRLDYLVNNAAYTPPNPIGAVAGASFQRADAEQDFDPERFDRAIAVNLRAPLQLALAAAGEGATLEAVVNVGSGSTQRGDGSSAYFVVSKGGIPSLTQYLARRLAPRVRVNALLPGLIATEQLDSRGPGFEPLRQEIIRRTPMGRLGTPAEAAEAILYLLAGNGFVTGTVLTLDGGWHL
ncbi:MAG TPA: SDR family oxidoreductase [Terriglobales bacterium]|nr:SDR family oxidoreductase [Terriglobales bacterium]